MKKEDLNYFSEKEKKFIYEFKELRNSFFLPLSKFFMKIGLTANTISYIGLFMLLGFIYYIFENPIFSLIFLLFHVLIDAFDGPLARLMNQDGNSGAFTDIICDHTGMVIVVITLIWANLINPVIASIYIYFYTTLIIFVIVRNKMNIPVRIVVRTKYYVYILFALFAIWNINYLNIGLIFFILTMFPSILSSYFIIKKELK